MKKRVFKFSSALLFTLPMLCSCGEKNESHPIFDSEEISIINFDRKDNLFNARVDNDVEVFSFINKVSIPKTFSWFLYNDFEAKNEISTKTVRCEEGENTFYLTVENGVEIVGFYTINIYRRHIYNVVFDSTIGETFSNQNVQEDSLVQMSDIPEREGYTFISWDYDFTKPVTDDLTITALWKANSYNVTLDSDGGIIDTLGIRIEYMSVFSFPIPEKKDIDLTDGLMKDICLIHTYGHLIMT